MYLNGLRDRQPKVLAQLREVALLVKTSCLKLIESWDVPKVLCLQGLGKWETLLSRGIAPRLVDLNQNATQIKTNSLNQSTSQWGQYLAYRNVTACGACAESPITRLSEEISERTESKLPMHKRLILTMLAAAVAVPTYSTKGPVGPIESIQPDMLRQVEYARQELKDGEWAFAMARANLVSFDRPLYVSVSYKGVDDSLKPTCEMALQAAFKVWADALGETQFRLTTRDSVADIKVCFEPEVKDGRYPVGGLVKWKRSIVMESYQPVQKTEASAQIRVNNPQGGNMSFEHLRHECAHEMGHVLGLEDSPRTGEIMSMLDLRRPVSRASSGEVDSLVRMRKLANEVKEEAVALAMSKV